MTCIVGIEQDGHIWMGGDSAVRSGWQIEQRTDPKVWIKNGCIIGVAGLARVSDLAAHAFNVPLRDPRMDLPQWLATQFTDALRDCLKTGGVAFREDEHEHSDSHFLIGVEGSIYSMGSGYSLTRRIQNYNAIGSGAEVALGCLYASRAEQDPKARIEQALEAAESETPFVRRPWTVLKLEGQS